MNPNVSILEQTQLVVAVPPIALTTARTGRVGSFKNYRRCRVTFLKGIGNASEAPTLTFAQGTDMAFGTTKALNITTGYIKADPTSLGDVGQRTKVTQAAGPTFTVSGSGDDEAIWEFDIKAEDLDIANDYDCLRVSIGDVGSVSQIGALIYEFYDPVQMMAPENMPSAIID